MDADGEAYMKLTSALRSSRSHNDDLQAQLHSKDRVLHQLRLLAATLQERSGVAAGEKQDVLGTPRTLSAETALSIINKAAFHLLKRVEDAEKTAHAQRVEFVDQVGKVIGVRAFSPHNSRCRFQHWK